jgi:hypothetical protein
MTRGRPFRYSADELAWIEENKNWPRKLLHKFFVMFFERPEVTEDALKQLCLRKGWKSGRDGRLQKGNIPPNKGRKGYVAPGSEKGWFPTGHLPANYRGPGYETLSKDGYVMIVIEDGVRYPSCPNRRTRPVLKHRVLWERAHGPIPTDHALKCLTRDRTNCDPSNWVLVPRAMLPRLAGRWGQSYDDAPDELKPTLLALARVEHAAREIKRRSKSKREG